MIWEMGRDDKLFYVQCSVGCWVVRVDMMHWRVRELVWS